MNNETVYIYTYIYIYMGHSEVKRNNFGQTAEKFPMAKQLIFLAYLIENTLNLIKIVLRT